MMRPATRAASSGVSPKSIWAGFRVWNALGGRLSRNLGRLAGAIAFAALVIGGSMLLMTPVGHWQDTVGKAMLISGIVGMLMTGIGALRRDHSQR